MEHPSKEWILPASIPFGDMKGSDLEQTVYWLLDAMGAKDLEWRSGGMGGGAADGGRDLEATFYAPSADGEMDVQKWWVECKGRSTTVEPDAVKSAVINAQSRAEIDVLTIATNTQFSNPTRDWVRDWQANHPRPKVKLWEHSTLERFLSRHPEVVLRLYAESLSLEGRLQAMESRFWNKLEFESTKTLRDLWKARKEIEFSGMGLLAAVVNEFSHGNIMLRPWGAVLEAGQTLAILELGLFNLGYLLLRADKVGAEQLPIFRMFAYLILTALEHHDPPKVATVIVGAINRNREEIMPDGVKEVLLLPIMDQLLAELRDVCSSDCARMVVLDRSALSKPEDEIKDYWQQFYPDGAGELPSERQILTLEKYDAPCVVGFKVNKDNDCPLFKLDAALNNLADLLAVVKRISAFRRAQHESARKKQPA